MATTLKYKIGDKVLIKDLDWYNKNKDPFGDIETEHTYFRDFMSCYCGKTMTIKSISTILGGAFYRMEEDLGQYCWEDEMIENKVSSKSQNPSMLSALERGFIDNIIDTLEFIEKDKAVCYTDEIELLKKIKSW